MQDAAEQRGGVIPSGLMRSYREQLESDLELVFESRQMKQIVDILPQYASEKVPVTVEGPVGAGKGAIARAIHLASPDWWRPFVEVDCSGMDDEVARRYLFGYEEPHLFSFKEIRQGIIAKASQTTLCIKNFDRYSRAAQAEFCDLVKNRGFRSAGGREEKLSNCRVVVTVQKSPDELKKGGYIDEDGRQLISRRVISVPPLSKRKEDIVPIAVKFIGQCCGEFGMPAKRLAKDAERWLRKAPWQKNALQMKKIVYMACLNTGGQILHPEDFALAHDGNLESYQEKQLDELSIQTIIEAKLSSFLGRLGSFEAKHLYDAIIERVEEPLLRLVMDYSRGNQLRASSILGINRNTLRAKLNKHKIKARRGR
jgi:two-component system nitrogen regulation response regulator GlnG